MPQKEVWDFFAKKYQDDKLASVCALGADKYYNAYIDKKHKEAVKRVLRLDGNFRVLDAGCGTGRWISWFKQNCTFVLGADFSETMIRTARKQGESRGAGFMLGSISSLSLRNESFDLIFSAYVLQHIVKDREFRKTVEEFIRVVKKNGKVVVLDIIDRKISKLFRRQYSTLVRYRSLDQYKIAFKESGARFICRTGVRFTLLTFLYTKLWEMILKRKMKKVSDVEKSDFLWQTVKESDLKPIFDSGFKTILKLSSLIDGISRLLPFFSIESVLIFEKN